jgi:P-type E1-E2 ATPase
VHRALPRQVRQFPDGQEPFVSITKLAPGRSLAVKVGECFAADGVVDRGESFVDQSLLIGEAEPVAKGRAMRSSPAPLISITCYS